MLNVCGCIFAITVFIPAPIMFGLGFSSLSYKRNTGANAIVNQVFQSDFHNCFASATFNNITRNITIPCQSINVTNLPISICYNRHNINNFAYADHDQHGDGYYTSNPYDFCSGVGYRAAKNMIYAGYTLCGVSFLIVTIIIINLLRIKTSSPEV